MVVVVIELLHFWCCSNSMSTFFFLSFCFLKTFAHGDYTEGGGEDDTFENYISFELYSAVLLHSGIPARNNDDMRLGFKNKIGDDRAITKS